MAAEAEAPAPGPPVAEGAAPCGRSAGQGDAGQGSTVAKPVAKPAAKTDAESAADLPPIGAKPAAMPIAAKGEVIIDPANPQPCAGSLVPPSAAARTC